MTITRKHERKPTPKPPTYPAVPSVRVSRHIPPKDQQRQSQSPPLPTRNPSSTTSTWSWSSHASTPTTYSGRTYSIFDNSSSPRSLSPSTSSIASTPKSTLQPSPKLSVRLGHNVPHCFVSRRFIAPQKCGYCHETLWAKRGQECAHCKFVCHSQCSQFVLEKCGLSSELESYGSVLSMFTDSDTKMAFKVPPPPSSAYRKEHRRIPSASSSFQLFSLRHSMSDPVPSTTTKGKRRTSVIDFRFLDRSRAYFEPAPPVHDIRAPSIHTSPAPTIASSESFSTPSNKSSSKTSIVDDSRLAPPDTARMARRSSVACLPFRYPTKDAFPSLQNSSAIFNPSFNPSFPTGPADMFPSAYPSRRRFSIPSMPNSSTTFSPSFNPPPFDPSCPTGPADAVPSAYSSRRRFSILSAPEMNMNRDFGGSSLVSESDIEIDFEELVIGERIGGGSFGEVHQGYWHGNCAIKLLKLKDPTEEQLETWRNEVEMMRNTRHERILLFMGVCAVPPNLALVTALCEKGSLYKHIHVLETQFTLQLVVNIATQIAEGLEYLHARGLLHNDLKSHNILLNHQFDVKIGDFGLSSLKRDNRLMNVQGSVHWLAPEIVRMKEGENPYTEKSDVWSYGMILYELLTSQLPYEGLMSEQILWQIGNGQHPSFDQLRTDTPAEMRRLISSCWEQDPTQRRSFHEILTVMSATRIRVGLSMRRTRSLQGLRDMWSFSFPGPGAGSGAGTDIMGGRGHTRYW